MCFEVNQAPFGLSPYPFGLSLSKPSRHWVGEPFDRLRANGGWAQGERSMARGEPGFVAHGARRGQT